MNRAKGYLVGGVLFGVSAAIIVWNWKNSWLPAISLGFLFRFFWWFVLALFNVGLIFMAGHLINRKLPRGAAGRSWPWQAAYAWASGSAALVLLGMILLACKLYAPISWNIISLAILAIAFCLYRQRRLFSADLSRQKIGSGLKNSWSAEARPGVSLSTAVAIVFLLLAFIQLFGLPGFRDEIAYHLFLPRLWEIQHHFWMPADNFHLLFPANMEVLWGFALGQGGVHLPRFITFVFGLMTILCLRQTFAEWKMDRRVIDLSLLFLLITPLALIGLAVCTVEWPLFFFLFLGWRAARQFLKTGERAELFQAAVCWGCSLGIKYTALPIVGLLFLDLCWNLFRARSRKSVFQAAAAMLLAAAVFLGPWAVRNYLVIGNPLHPLTLANVLAPKAAQANDAAGTLMSYSGLHGWWKLNPWLFHATFENQVDEKMHVGWPILLCLALGIGWRWRRELPWLVLVCLTCLFFHFGPSARIYFPLMGFCLLFLPRLLDGARDWLRPRFLTQALLLVYALPCLAAVTGYFFLTANRADQDYFLGIKDDAAYLRAAGLVTPVQAFIQQRLPGDARIWTWCEDKGFYFERWVLPTAPYGTPAFLKLFRQGGGQALDDRIRREQIDFLVINSETCDIRKGTIRLDKTVVTIGEDEGRRLQAWMKKALRPMLKDYRFELYRVVRERGPDRRPAP